MLPYCGWCSRFTPTSVASVPRFSKAFNRRGHRPVEEVEQALAGMLRTKTPDWHGSFQQRRAFDTDRVRNDLPRDLLLCRDDRTASQSSMTIETSEQYLAAIERLKALGDNPAEGSDQEQFFEISAAMVEYETSGAAMKGIRE